MSFEASADKSFASVLDRPVLGQKMAQDFFANAARVGRLSHAYLLVGPEGVGKRTLAQHLIAAVLCRYGPEKFCNECASCSRLRSDNHLGFQWIEPSATGKIRIDQIRLAIQEIMIRSTDRRVILIDQADCMNLEAANAVLKTLEEPPPGVMFFLVSSTPAGLLNTIHSRCHRMPLRSLEFEAFCEVMNTFGLLQDLDQQGQLELFLSSTGSPGIALNWLQGVEECGGIERMQSLLSGEGIQQPESLIDYVPARGDEKRRLRLQRLLFLLRTGLRGQARLSQAQLVGADGPDAQANQAQDLEFIQSSDKKLQQISELSREAQSTIREDLILEQLAKVLR